jgi:hypothetical protein
MPAMTAPAKKVGPSPTPITVSPTGLSAPTDIAKGRSSQDIAALAYQHWQARRCPDGSPEEDWFKAERELQCDG